MLHERAISIWANIIYIWLISHIICYINHSLKVLPSKRDKHAPNRYDENNVSHSLTTYKSEKETRLYHLPLIYFRNTWIFGLKSWVVNRCDSLIRDLSSDLQVFNATMGCVKEPLWTPVFPLGRYRRQKIRSMSVSELYASARRIREWAKRELREKIKLEVQTIAWFIHTSITFGASYQKNYIFNNVLLNTLDLVKYIDL